MSAFADFHPDQFYKVHSSTSANHACHSGHGAAGTYGSETSDCDSPISLANATFDWITANLRDEIDFVIWTGDNARHDSDEDYPRSASDVLGTNRLMATKFAETFINASGFSIPVVPTFGNNDILPHNIMLPGPNKWLDYYTDIWKNFIPEIQRHSFEFGGWFYVEVIPNKLAVFSLNTLYFFDRNAAIDDCIKPSEPGFKQLEWLRVQLQFLRERGMKAILMGHVPPARTDSKMLWDESCWQKYTLWLKQYRDVVISGLYGHMNIDHFILADTKDITIDSAIVTAETEAVETSQQSQDPSLSIQSAIEYLEELRKKWTKLPEVTINSEGEFQSEKKKKDKKKKKKKDKNKKKLGGEWAERYQVSLISPSIVPNYFPTLRVYEYNLTGIEDAIVWAEYTDTLPTVDGPYGSEDLEVSQPEMELRSLPEVEIDKKKKKKKKTKKPKDGNINDPNLVVPLPPSKSSPPGPAYSSQSLTLTGYKQYFANLTYINNDIKIKDSELDTEKWRDGKHGDRMPKSKKPNPREFEFEIEYTTHDEFYNLTDLTVRSMVKLAYRMGQAAKGKTAELLLPGGDITDDLNDIEPVTQQEDIDRMGQEDITTDDEEDGDGGDDDLEAEKKQKKKKKAKKLNETWLQFLKFAFVSTVDDEKLKSKFS